MQESNPGLLRCRRILYLLSYEGNPGSPVSVGKMNLGEEDL